MAKAIKKGEDTRLSYSSGQLLKNCTQKYHYYKVVKVEKDSDSEENFDAFNVGKAFHWVLESNGHSVTNVTQLVRQACIDFEVVYAQNMIHAMVLKYLKLHTESGLECVNAEFKIEDEKYLGFVDAIMTDPEGNWWIVDLKTAARFGELTYKKLISDPQLNLYAHYAPTIAKGLDLDVEKFTGVRYRATTKSKLKQKKTESDREFIIRVYNSISTYDAYIYKDDLVPKQTWDDHLKLHKLSMDLRTGKVKPTKNFSWCDSFFRPCEYWSQCHGSNFTENEAGKNFL